MGNPEPIGNVGGVVSKLSRKDVLINYHNKHLDTLMTAEINIIYYGTKDAKDVAYIEQNPPLAPGQPPMSRKILIKEALEREQHTLENQTGILAAITQLLKKEK